MNVLPRLSYAAGLLLPIAPQQLGWDGQANSDLLTLAPTGHRAGVYHVVGVLVVRAVGAGGIVDRVLTFNAPGLPGISMGMPAPAGVGAGPGLYATDAIEIVSDGSAPITVQFQPGGVVPPAEIDLYACAILLNRRA